MLQLAVEPALVRTSKSVLVIALVIAKQTRRDGQTSLDPVLVTAPELSNGPLRLLGLGPVSNFEPGLELGLTGQKHITAGLGQGKGLRFSTSGVAFFLQTAPLKSLFVREFATERLQLSSNQGTAITAMPNWTGEYCTVVMH
eukprot:s991_g20.t1